MIMQRKALLILCVLLLGLGFFSTGNVAYALNSVNSGGNTSYYLIYYNGEKQEFPIDENITLTLSGWTDGLESSVNGQILLNSSSQTEEVRMVVSNELSELTLTDTKSIHYRFVKSDSFNVKTISPNELTNQITVVAENDNGTSIENVESVDKYGTVIGDQGLLYYKVDDHNKKTNITKEEYLSLNPDHQNSLGIASSKNVSNMSEGSSAEEAEGIFPQELIPYNTKIAEEPPSVNYATYVEGIGWLHTVSNGEMAGTEGQAKRLESIKITVDNVRELGVKYSTHVQDHGWLGFVSDGQESRAIGEAKQLEAIKIELTGNKAVDYDLFYRVHVQKNGWLDWVKNGEISGTTGESNQLEAIEIMILEKGSTPPTLNDSYTPEEPNITPSVTYKTHVQNKGWLDAVSDGKLSGTVGEAKQLEAIQISLENARFTGGVSYKTHIQDYGWLTPVSDGTTSGTTGKNKQVEAIQVSLNGEIAKHYDIYYRVHSQNFGWLDWAKNGESSGTEGLSRQIEAIELVLVEKGGKAPGSTENPFYKKPSVVYTTHIETYGWSNAVKNGSVSGTSGQAKRLEGIKIDIQDAPYSGNIIYSTHVQNIGWLTSVSNGELSGTVGQAKRLEAIKIDLTGELAKYYDVHYRVHIQDEGWLGWAKDGMKAGSEGLSKQVEAIEVKLVPQGQNIPLSNKVAFKKPLTVFLDPGHGGSDPGATAGGYHEADLNLSVAKKVQSLLLAKGYKVYMSRNTDTYVSLYDRPQMANDLNTDIFVSIHTNSTGSGVTTASGIESYYYEYDPNYPSKINGAMHNNPDRIKKSVSLTNLIHENMIDYTGAGNRGTDGDTFAVIREASMPATLIEIGFINNSSERQKLITTSYQNRLAKAIAEGIDEYFKNY